MEEEPLNLCKKPMSVVASCPDEQEQQEQEDEESQMHVVARSEQSGVDPQIMSVFQWFRHCAQNDPRFMTALTTANMLQSTNMLAGRNAPFFQPSPWAPPTPMALEKPLSISVPRIEHRFPVNGLTVPTLSPQPSAKHQFKKPNSKWSSSLDHKSSSSTNDSSKSQDSAHTSNNQAEKKKPHIKKPLNAFMLYMKEMRAKVVAECTLKESAAINQILGRRWHSLTREEQAKYYEKARVERQLHMELYPGWSARDNYGYGAKKKKRKKERVTITDSGGNSMKKCRARYGLDQQGSWCKPCRRKKKCIRYKECGDDGTTSEDNIGSVDSRASGDCDGESYQQSSSESTSPGGLSGLSSLTSPGLLASPVGSLASPSVSLASPCQSMQSPLTPIEYHPVDTKPPVQLVRLPVGHNPHDSSNPLSVNQLTGKCIKSSSSSSSGSPGHHQVVHQHHPGHPGHHPGGHPVHPHPHPHHQAPGGGPDQARTVISVP